MLTGPATFLGTHVTHVHGLKAQTLAENLMILRYDNFTGLITYLGTHVTHVHGLKAQTL